MKKPTTILLSAIILGGFCYTTLNSTATDVEATKSSETRDMPVPNGQILNFDEKFDLNELGSEAFIPIEAYAETGKFLEVGYIKLNQRNIWDLQEKKKTTVATPTIETESNAGGYLEYEASNVNLNMVYDEKKQTFTLFDKETPVRKITCELTDGSATIHYLFKDTKKEFFTAQQEDAFAYHERGDKFMVSTLKEIDDSPKLIGYFDAYDLDFEGFTQWDPLNDIDGGAKSDEPIIKKFDRKTIDKESNNEFNVYLEKAMPYTINYKVYLDNKPYFSKKITAELNDQIPLQDEPKMPDSSLATLNKDKTAFSTIYEYLPQLGTTIRTGSVLYRKIFEQNFGKVGSASSIDNQPNFLNTGIYGISGEKLEDNQVLVKLENAGRTSTLELYYESNQSDETDDNEVTADVTISSNLGNQVVPNVTGKIGSDISVTVPVISGHVADKKTVTAHVNQDGTITTKEKITYTIQNTAIDKPNNNNSSTNNDADTSSNLPSKYNGLIATMKKNVNLYDIKDGKMVKNKQRQLAALSDWKVDQIITLNGTKYYRVATNEWVKDHDIYRYINQSGVINTKNVSITNLFSAETQLINNRGLANDTAWKYDRIAYLGDNETKHYRVATNEFVKASDVFTK
ncbi:SLAP domain-containing protein [Companilactobacillus alimentarius]|uniref:SLAP domain-containing protein n=1 Tax=Companilactobacillus alimentarius TaxID=1602 RepID=UPI0028B524C3|nr:hypothetical protein [Companilactobacillus alimentarius]MDT6952909.1 hypothetical protein [Companilactobacillus alimentarius]